MLAWCEIFSQWTQLCETWNAYWNVCLFTPRLWFEIRPKLTVAGSCGCSICSHRSVWNRSRCVVPSWRYTTQAGHKAAPSFSVAEPRAGGSWKILSWLAETHQAGGEAPGQTWWEGTSALALVVSKCFDFHSSLSPGTSHQKWKCRHTVGK